MKLLEKIIEWGLYLFVFLLPWQTRLILAEGNLNGYWEYGTKSIYATEILLWLIFLLAAVWWTINKIKNKNSPSQLRWVAKSKFVFAFLCLFVVWSLISVFWADSKSLALYAWHWLVEGVGLFLVLQVIKFDLRKMAWSFILSALLQAGLGAWQFLTQTTFASKWLGMATHDPAVPGTFVVETALRRWLRAYGGLPHPNMLAGFLAMAMFLAMWLYQKIDYGIKKIFPSVIFAALSLGLFTTFSKSVIGGFAVVMILWWVIILVHRQSKEIKIDLMKFTLIFLVIAVIFGVVFWEPVQTRITGAERLEIKSTTERLSYFGEAWQIIKIHPLLGVGLGGYTLAVHNEINQNLASWDYQPVHNIYLLILAELGAIGFIFWLTLIFLLIKKLPVTRLAGRQAHYLLLITLLIVGLFDHYLWTLYFGVAFFWLCLGMVYRPVPQGFDRPLDKH